VNAPRRVSSLPVIPLQRFGLVAITAIAVCSSHAAGVTVATHGFNGNITDWVIPMLERVPRDDGFHGTNFSCYSISIRESSGSLVATRALLSGRAPLATDSGETLIKLDWSELAGVFGASSTEVATVAANALLSPTLFPEIGGRRLAELPLHLIGHSRGGSVISEMTRLLGAQGIWVDHLTLLDPHPVAEFGDAAVNVWQNILFAESYWQMNSDFTCPDGASEFGAYNRQLTSLSGGYTCPHSDVHLWYLGTIDLTTPTGNNDEVISQSERATWWTQFEAAGAHAGFRYSRIGGGNRLSSAEPAGAGNGRIRDGMNQRWNFGAGATDNRTTLPANNRLWPNVIQVNLTGTNALSPGGSTSARVFLQTGTNQATALNFYLDLDSNPWNSNEVQLATGAIAATGSANVLETNLTFSALTNVPPGEYALLAEAFAGGRRQRFLYAPETVTILSPPEPPRFAGVTRDSSQVHLTVETQVGRRVVLEGSPNLASWIPLATNVATSSTITFVDAPSDQHRFYRAVAVP
jgi:hypothetical protein